MWTHLITYWNLWCFIISINFISTLVLGLLVLQTLFSLISFVFFVLVSFYIILFVLFFANLPILFYRFSTPKKQEANIDIWFYLLFLWTVYLVTNKFLCLLKWVWVFCLNRTCCVAIIFSRIIHEGILPPTVVLWNVQKMLSMRTMIIKYCTYLLS